MLSDYAILAMARTDDIAEIKRAFRRRVKELHPDTADSSLSVEALAKNHFLFVEVCMAYDRLCAECAARSGAKGEGASREPGERPPVGAVSAQSQTPTALRAHSDPAYAFYRNGCKFFSMIHPSSWNLDRTITVNAKTEEDERLQAETREKVRSLVSLFPKAYYYFSLVVHEYPASEWAADAREKMSVIERRMGMYKNIIESFVAWNDYETRNKAAFEDMMRDNKEKYDAFKKEYRDAWKG